MDKTVISCEISFLPIQSNDYVGEVEEVIRIIRSYDLEITEGLMSTTVRGEPRIIFDLLANIFERMNQRTKFTMVIKISNICGCPPQSI